MKRNLLLSALMLTAVVFLNDRTSVAQAPPYCRPCLFYGGDFDATNPAANVLANGILFHGRSAAVYVPFVVPANQIWTVTGIFSNNMSMASVLVPPALKWNISSGVSSGNQGQSIAGGNVHATFTPTGRTWEVYTEYTALGRLRPADVVTLTGGVYWLSAVPICTDPSCGFASFFISDVEDVPAPHHVGIEPNDESFYLVDDEYFFVPTAYPNGICNGGGNGTGCNRFSAGLLGYAQPTP